MATSTKMKRVVRAADGVGMRYGRQIILGLVALLATVGALWFTGRYLPPSEFIGRMGEVGKTGN